MFTPRELSRGMLDTLSTVDSIVEALGGNAAAGGLVGVKSPAVSNWRDRGRIPKGHLFVFSDVLAKAGKRPAPEVFGFSGEVRA